jgi:hypothetical protein
VIVDHEQPVRLGGDGPQRSGSGEQLASCQVLVAQLDDVRAAPYGRQGERGQTRRVDVGSDEVEPAGR